MSDLLPRIHLALRPDAGIPLDSALALAKAAGFDGTELSLPSLGVVIGGRVREDALTRLRRTVADAGLHTTLHAPLSLNLMDEDHADIHMAVARAALRVAEETGATVLVVHPGWLPPGPVFAVGEGAMRREAERLAELAADAEGRGVLVVIENMPAVSARATGGRVTYAVDPAMVAAQARAVAHPALATCLDISHAAIAATARGADLATDIRAMSPGIGHIHMHDSFARAPGLFLWTHEEAATFGIGDTHLPPGWGVLDFDALLHGLKVRPGTRVTLEIAPPHLTPDIAPEVLARARRAASGLIAG